MGKRGHKTQADGKQLHLKSFAKEAKPLENYKTKSHNFWCDGFIQSIDMHLYLLHGTRALVESRPN